jgi:hypothetical protein
VQFKQNVDLEQIAKNLVIGYNMLVLDTQNKICEFWCSDSILLKPTERQSDFVKLDNSLTSVKDKELLNHAKSPVKIGSVGTGASIDSG